MPEKTIHITVISDMMCPWCYIGHRELENAITASPDLPLRIEVEYKPYRLMHMDEDEEQLKNDLLASKFGAAKVEHMASVLRARGEELDIDFHPNPKVSQTTRAHRLMLKAWQVGGMDQQQKVLKGLFHKHFEEGQAFSVSTLSTIAEEAGLMTKAEATAFLESDENLAEVNTAIHESQANGVTGVPFTIIQGKWAISGGQTADVYQKIFRKLATCVNAGACSEGQATPKAASAVLHPAPAPACHVQAGPVCASA